MKKVLASLISLALALTCAACGGGSNTPTEGTGTHDEQTSTGSGTESGTGKGGNSGFGSLTGGGSAGGENAGGEAAGTETVDESEILKAYEEYMLDFLDRADWQEGFDYEYYLALQECIYNNDYSQEPGPHFFDGSMQAGAAQTYDEFKADYLAEQAILNDPSYIHIQTPEDFLNIANNLDGRYILDNDIDDWWGGESTIYTPIGTPEKPFTGELNGNGHKITGTLAGYGDSELFGYFGANAGYIHDLTIGSTSPVEWERYNNDFAGYNDNGLTEDREHTYTSVDSEGLPTDVTKYFGVLCAYNTGTIENITFQDYAYMPEFLLYPNSNDEIYIGFVCGYNAGTISGVSLHATSLWYRTLDKTTAVSIGTICGYAASTAVIEDISLFEASTYVEAWGYADTLAPVVYAGLLAGQAEGGARIANASIEGTSVRADQVITDSDVRLGGVVGYASGDIAISGISLYDVFIALDGLDDYDDYTPYKDNPMSAGGIIGWADGNVSLSDCTYVYGHVSTIRRGNLYPRTYAGGMVGYCGGNLTAANVTVTNAEPDEDFIVHTVNVSPSAEVGIAYGGGLCGYCAGTTDVSDCLFSLCLNPVFNGSVLYESNVLGYAVGDVTVTNSQIDCGTDPFTGDSNSNGFIAISSATYYLASIAGCAEGSVDVSGCYIDVHYNLFGTPGAYYYSYENEGMYNRPA